MIEQLFGIKAIERWFKVFTPERIYGCHPWVGKNFQSKSPICPHYQLVEMCAETMETKKDELALFPYFCGVGKKDIMVGDRFGRRKEVGGAEEIPFRTCEAIAEMMEFTINIAKNKEPGPVPKMSVSPDKKERDELEKFLKKAKAYDLGQEILKKWRTSIPQIILIEANPHDVMLISVMENLREQLKIQAVDGCDRAPKHHYNQWLYID